MLHGQGDKMLTIILIFFFLFIIALLKWHSRNMNLGNSFFFFHHTAMKVVAYNPLALQAEHLVLGEVTIVTTTQWDRMSMMLTAQKKWWCINDFCIGANRLKKRERKKRKRKKRTGRRHQGEHCCTQSNKLVPGDYNSKSLRVNRNSLNHLDQFYLLPFRSSGRSDPGKV